MIVYLQMIETNEDKSKFEEIYQEYKNLMYYVAYKRMQHEQDAEDVVHHVFVKIAENIKHIEPVSPKTKQLIVTMVDNRVTDIFRVRGRHPVVMYNDELKNSPVIGNEGEDLLTECILKLPEQQRMVIWMKYRQGYPLREIAKMLGISLVWAQKIDQRAKKKLEELYLEGGRRFMITEEMLCTAAARSCELYSADLESGYNADVLHEFSPAFEKKIRKLKRRADYPAFYRTMNRVASILLAILIAIGAWISVDAEARAAFFGWVKETYETFFVYRFSDDIDISVETDRYEPSWIPEGYEKSRESDLGGKITIVYKNQDGQLLRFHYIYDLGTTSAFVDAEGGTIKKCKVGDYDADLIVFDDRQG